MSSISFHAQFQQLLNMSQTVSLSRSLLFCAIKTETGKHIEINKVKRGSLIISAHRNINKMIKNKKNKA